MPRYTPFAFQGFGGGLNLQAKADAVDPAQCIDALNVNFSDRGAIQQRDGYAALTGSELTNRADSLCAFYTSTGTKQLLAGCGTRLEALNASGEVSKSATGLTGGPWGFVRFGQPNEEVAYVGNGSDTLRKWTGTEWKAPTATVDKEAGKAMPKARYLAVQSPDNRLVATGFATTTGGPNGTTSSPSHVYFSDAGNPESWTSLNYEQLTPGDGEAIQGCIAWREFVFVFKETKFFVFYGNGTDAEGSVEFNRRPVEAGVGLASPRALCAHRTGVYFLDRKGVYRTTGQEPELVSSAIEPIFVGEASHFYTGGTLAQGKITNAAMSAFNERVFLSFPTEEANNRTLVFDPNFEWWSLYDLPCAALTTFRPSNAEELIFAYASGAKKIGRHSTAYTNDAEAAITAYWRSGWFDLGSPDIKKIRASKAWGTGKVRMGVAHDFERGVGTLSELNMESTGAPEWSKKEWGGFEWGEPKGLVLAHRRIAQRGTAFSMYFKNETKDQEWSLHRIEHLVSGVEDPSKGRA